jgi:uncharacterized protein with HEPN domain
MHKDDAVRLRHFDIDRDIVWNTVADDLPTLASQLERALAAA